MNDIIDFSLIASELQAEMKQSIKGCIIRPSLAVVEVGNNKISEYKVKQIEDICNKVGVYFRYFKYEDDTPELTIINKIKELNNDDYVNGVMIQLPLPEKYNDKRIINTIINSKDIFGITDINIGRFISGRKTIASPASLTILEIFKMLNIELVGKNVALIGKGKTVGRPILMTLLNENTTVTVCNSKTDDISKYTHEKDILISACGVPKLITKDMVDDKTIVIDFGYSIEKDKIIGDIDSSIRKEKKEGIIGAEEGIWDMFVTMCLKNLLICYNSKKSTN